MSVNVPESAAKCASKNQAAKQQRNAKQATNAIHRLGDEKEPQQQRDAQQPADATLLFSTIVERRKEHIRRHTQQGDGVLMKHLTAFGGEKLAVTKVDPEFCKGFAEYLTSVGKLKRSSAKYFLQKFHALLQDAIFDGCIPVNPMPPISRLIAKEVSVERESLTVEEIQRLCCTPCRHAITQLAFLFSVFTGLRLSDVETLRWDHIIKVNGSYLVKKIQVKTNDEVRLPLSSHAQAILATVRESHLDKGDIVFPLYTRPTTSKDLNQWAKAAAIDKHITFHLSRISFVTLSLSANVNIVIVSKLCGHKDIKTTQMYARIVDRTFEMAIHSLDQLFDGEQKEDTPLQTYWKGFNSVL